MIFTGKWKAIGDQHYFMNFDHSSDWYEVIEREIVNTYRFKGYDDDDDDNVLLRNIDNLVIYKLSDKALFLQGKKSKSSQLDDGEWISENQDTVINLGYLVYNIRKF